ncbi:MAG: hypothetical protein AAF960_00340 [Bacteroidota bacterium]
MIELDPKFSNAYVLFLYLSLFLVCCHQAEQPEWMGQRVLTHSKAELKVLSVHTALPTTVKSPKTNPTSAAKVNLGRLLFFDPHLVEE